MFEDIREIFDALNEPRYRHAAMVHMPIALSVLGVLLALVAAIAGEKGRTMTWTAVVAFTLLVITGKLAEQSGQDAEAFVATNDQVVLDALHTHEEMAHKVWLFGMGPLALLLVAGVTHKGPRVAAAWLAVPVSVAVVGWVAITAHHGGVLVYEHGVGVTSDPAVVPVDPDAPIPEVIVFDEHVAPIMTQHCVRCHNPAGAPRAGRLDLTTRAAIVAGGIGGPVFEAGDSAGSLLIEAVEWRTEDFQMPPDAAQLSDREIEILRRWIDAEPTGSGSSSGESSL